MPSVTLTIIKRTSSQNFDTFQIADTSERSRNITLQIQTEQGLRMKLHEMPFLSRKDIQAIVARVEGAEQKHIQSYLIDEATYSLLLG
jgi:hypothetical protein